MAAAVSLASPLRRVLHVPFARRAIPTSYHFFPSGRCHAALSFAAAAAGDSAVKASLDRNAAEELRSILDMAQRASQRRDVFHTNFLTPPIVKECMLAIEKLADIKAVAQGGYPQAERCRVSVGHPDSMTSNPDGERGAQVLVDPELVDYLTSTLEKVGKVGVSCTQIPLLALEYEPPRTKSFKTVESSLRVDALGSAGFKISRTKLASLISAGDVRVNWSPVSKNGVTLKAGDIVSVSGMGRLKIGEIVTTRKGKRLVVDGYVAYH
uniref:RNA-binding S4 domain-containing protein n=1 Tax=Oryza meridionalis TaxID=40149 RepID=A0A0E0C7N8_9ORYZ